MEGLFRQVLDTVDGDTPGQRRHIPNGYGHKNRSFVQKMGQKRRMHRPLSLLPLL